MPSNSLIISFTMSNLHNFILEIAFLPVEIWIKRIWISRKYQKEIKIYFYVISTGLYVINIHYYKILVVIKSQSILKKKICEDSPQTLMLNCMGIYVCIHIYTNTTIHMYMHAHTYSYR